MVTNIDWETKITTRIRDELILAARAMVGGSAYADRARAEDLAQDALMEALTFLRETHLRPDLPVDQPDMVAAAGKAWGMTCLKHAFIDEQRSARLRYEHVADGQDPHTACPQPTPEDHAGSSWLLRSCRRLLTSVHRDRYLDALRAMLDSCSDQGFDRRALAVETRLKPKQLQRIADEIIRRQPVDATEKGDI